MQFGTVLSNLTLLAYVYTSKRLYCSRKWKLCGERARALVNCKLTIISSLHSRLPPWESSKKFVCLPLRVVTYVQIFTCVSFCIFWCKKFGRGLLNWYIFLLSMQNSWNWNFFDYYANFNLNFFFRKNSYFTHDSN